MTDTPDTDPSAEQQAADWIARRDRGLSAGERRAFGDWLAEPANRDALDAVEALWRELGALDELAAEPAAAAAPAVRRARDARWPLAIAAGIAVAAIAWLALPPAATEPRRVVAAPRPVIHETAVGGLRSVTLDDGTTAVLNTDTRIRVEYSAERRDVTLVRGEAYFEVAHAPQRPFRVEVGGPSLVALGTAFSVHRGPDAVELIVTEGRVGVQAESHGAADAVPVVVAGQRGILDAERLALETLSPADRDVALAWRRGMLVFENARLRDVLVEFNRYTQRRLVLDDPALGELGVVGFFPAGDLEALLAALSRNFEIEAQGRGEEIVLTAR